MSNELAFQMQPIAMATPGITCDYMGGGSQTEELHLLTVVQDLMEKQEG
jgi:hypothetical protein